MEYVKLGRTGLEVSRICLGCMSYGSADSGNHAWSLGEEQARPFITGALEGGINFFDTANRYSLGSSEEILGRAIRDFAHRDEVVIATKVYGRMPPGPNGGGLSRKAIMKRSRRYTTSSRPVRPAISARHARSQSFHPRCIPWTEGVPPVDPDQGSLRAPFRNPQPLIAAASTQRAFMPS